MSTTSTASHYQAAPTAQAIEQHTLAVIVDNEPGVLARVIGLFSGRGYNIESLTVSETEHEKHLSRITIVTRGTPMVIEQIKNQLERLVPIHRVVDMTVAGPSIQRELAMIKVRGTGEPRVEAAENATRVALEDTGAVGGAQGVLVTAVSPKAFEQALAMVDRGGTVSLNGLPPGDFPLSIFDTVLNGVTVRGSIVGTRLDLQEALDFAAHGKFGGHCAAGAGAVIDQHRLAETLVEFFRNGARHRVRAAARRRAGHQPQRLRRKIRRHRKRHRRCGKAEKHCRTATRRCPHIFLLHEKSLQ